MCARFLLSTAAEPLSAGVVAFLLAAQCAEDCTPLLVSQAGYPKVALRAMGFPVKKQDVKELLRRQGEEDSEQLDFRQVPGAGVKVVC